MACVIDLCQRRRASRPLPHPAGVTLPVEDPGHADLLIPPIRQAIESGRHCADVIHALPAALRAGERVLVVGSGLGVLSTLIARARGVAQVIVIEPNIALAAYIDQVHRLNGVPWIETLNAVPVKSGRGRVPLFVRHDVRTSSLVPDDGPWRQVMLVPGVDLDLILTEERIGLIVGESSALSAPLLAHAQLGSVDQMLFGSHCVTEGPCEQDDLAARLAARGFATQRSGTALICGRANGGKDWAKRTGTSG